MDRGYKAILEKLPRGEDGGGDIGAIFKLVAMTLISKVGGASGPLYGTLFLEGGKPLSGKSELTAEELARFFDDAIAGVIKRGRARGRHENHAGCVGPIRRSLQGSAF